MFLKTFVGSWSQVIEKQKLERILKDIMTLEAEKKQEAAVSLCFVLFYGTPSLWRQVCLPWHGKLLRQATDIDPEAVKAKAQDTIKVRSRDFGPLGFGLKAIWSLWCLVWTRRNWDVFLFFWLNIESIYCIWVCFPACSMALFCWSCFVRTKITAGCGHFHEQEHDYRACGSVRCLLVAVNRCVWQRVATC